MSNLIQTQQEIRIYLIARVPLVILDTAERSRAERILRAAAEELSLSICYYTDAHQVRSIGSREPQTDVNGDPLPFAASLFKHKAGAVFALGDTRRIGEDSSFARETLNLVSLARENRCTLILITPDPVWPRLAQCGMLVQLDLPDLEERRDQILHFIQTYQRRYPIRWTGAEIDRAVALMQGFSEAQIENILSAQLIASHGLSQENLAQLSEQKSRLYAAVPSIQMVRVPSGLLVSGLDNLKSWLQEKQQVFFAPDAALQEYDLQPPRGILLVGVPGCGKSLSAKMVAAQWELPLFRFDLGTVYDKYVGESEKKMKDALQFLDNMAPCVVWIDEIEKALAVSEGSNDIGRHMLGQFLFWLQESESRIFLVATANEISSLPSELFRKGRFSEIFFVDLPTGAERAAALCEYCRRSLRACPEGQALDLLVQASDGFSYADLAYAVKNLAEKLLTSGSPAFSWNDLLERLHQIIPYAKTNPETLHSLRTWGKERAVNASHQSGGICP